MRKHIINCTLTTLLTLFVGTAVQAQSQYSNAVVSLNPLIYLPLTETAVPPSPTVAINSGTLGANDNGVYDVGACPGVPGAIVADADKAAVFAVDGGSASIGTAMLTPYDTAYATITNFTIEFWVNSAIQDPGYPTTEDCIINCVDAASPRAGWLVYSCLSGPGIFTFRTYFQSGTTPALSYDMPVPGGHIKANTWYHVVITYSGATGTAQGYINGVPVATQGTASKTGGIPNYVGSTANGLFLGERSDSSFLFYPGAIDEVAIYPSVLSAGVVSNHYVAATNTVAGAYSSLVLGASPLLYFRLDDAVPVATNYGSAGAIDNGLYQSGTTPGSAGPNLPGMGGSSSYAVQFPGGTATDNGSTVLVPGAEHVGDANVANAPITVTAWALVPYTPAAFSTVLGRGDSSYRFDVDTTGFAHWNAGVFADIVASVTEISDGNWHFWAGTYDGSNAMNLYIDGELVASSTDNTGNPATTNVLDLGSAPDYDGRNFDGGSLCQVAIFTNALSLSQIVSLYESSGITGVPPVIVAQPQNVLVGPGSNFTLTVTASSDSPPLSYQWYSNSVPVGANSSSFTVTGATTNADGTYYVIVTDSESSPESTTSSNAYVNVVTPLSGAYFAAVEALSPIGYWPLNETIQPFASQALNIGTLGAADDGYYSPGVVYQQPGLIADVSGAETNYSVLLSATNQVVAPYSSALSNMPPFTVELWAQTLAPGTEQCVISCIDAGVPSGERSGWLIYMDATTSGVYQFRAYNKNGTATSITLTAATAVAAATTHHLVIVVSTNVGGTLPNSSGIYPANSITAKFYLDGTLSASTTGSYAMDDGGDGGGFSIGARSDNAFNFDGLLSEVAYYPYALSAATISSHYSAGTSQTPSPAYYQTVLNTPEGKPILYYQLNDSGQLPPESAQPVATNYGSLGALDNGYYLAGTFPGSVAGPGFAGFPGGKTAANVAVRFAQTNWLPGGSAGSGNQGLGGYVDVPVDANDSLDVLVPVTLAAWIQAKPNDARFETAVGRGDGSFDIDVIGTSSDLLEYYEDGVVLDGVPPSGAVNDGNWHFVVEVYDGTKQILYVDGLQNAEQGVTGSPVQDFNDFTIGEAPDETNRVFDGNVSEVALFDYALSPNQVQSLYFAGGISPIITTEPPATVTVPLGAGGTSTLSVVATGTPTLTYEWSTNNGQTLLSGPEFSGTTTSSLTITSPGLSDNASYVVVVSNAFGAVTSTPTVFTATDLPVLSPLPAITYVVIGSTLSLSTTVAGPAPLTNAWYANGVKLVNGTQSSGAMVSGATTSSLTISNVQLTNAGTYVLFASNSYGYSNSTPGIVVVDPEPLFRDTGSYSVVLGSSGFSTGTFTPVVTNGVLQLTSDAVGAASFETGAFWFNQPVYVGAFQVRFTFSNALDTFTGGKCFVLQNCANGTKAYRDPGACFGYATWGFAFPPNGITNSFAFEVDDWNYSKMFALETNGVVNPLENPPPTIVQDPPVGYLNASPEFQLGDYTNWTLDYYPAVIDISITYFGGNITVGYSNELSGITGEYVTNVGPEYVQSAVGGSNVALMGFTAGTELISEVPGSGTYYASESDSYFIYNFSYTPIIALSITKTNGGGVALKWPTGVGGYLLQSTTNLSTTNWTTLQPAYSTNSSDTMYQYVASPATGDVYYRLILP